MKPTYDTTLARMAGNIAAGLSTSWSFWLKNILLMRWHQNEVAQEALEIAEQIVFHLKYEAVEAARETHTG